MAELFVLVPALAHRNWTLSLPSSPTESTFKTAAPTKLSASVTIPSAMPAQDLALAEA